MKTLFEAWFNFAVNADEYRKAQFNTVDFTLIVSSLSNHGWVFYVLTIRWEVLDWSS